MPPIEFVSVIIVKNGVVDENHLFVGQHEDIAKNAEDKYLELCRTHVSNFDEYDVDDINNILMDGYCELGTGSICINWPEHGYSED